MATGKTGSYKEEAIKFHESWIIDKDITEIRSLLYPKFEKLDAKKIHDFKEYLEKL